jgi:hypothetical protein
MIAVGGVGGGGERDKGIEAHCDESAATVVINAGAVSYNEGRTAGTSGLTFVTADPSSGESSSSALLLKVITFLNSSLH